MTRALKITQGFLLLSAIIGFALVLVSTHLYGAGLSVDSVRYVAVARNLAAGKGFIGIDGSPLIAQPPLYPALLAAIKLLFAIDPLYSANVVNAILFGFIVYLSGLLSLRYLDSSLPNTILSVVLVVVLRPLLDVSKMAWTEPLFILLVLLFFVVMELYLVDGDIKLLISLALIVAAACMTR